MSFLLVCFLLQASHAPYYTFYTLYLSDFGYSKTLIGFLWALGVLFEVIIFLKLCVWVGISNSDLDNELKTFWGWSYQAYINLLVERTEISEHQKILDIATGTAMIPRKIIQKNIPGIQITGLDFTESMLLHGKQELSSSLFPDIISLICGDAMALPFAAESFDVIVTGLASHHMNIPLFNLF